MLSIALRHGSCVCPFFNAVCSICLPPAAPQVHDAYFVDLFVRVSNTVAISMYRSFGYSVYRTVLQYYSGDEDAYDMRKAMPRDVHKKSVIPLKKPVRPEELEFD